MEIPHSTYFSEIASRRNFARMKLPDHNLEVVFSTSFNTSSLRNELDNYKLKAVRVRLTYTKEDVKVEI